MVRENAKRVAQKDKLSQEKEKLSLLHSKWPLLSIGSKHYWYTLVQIFLLILTCVFKSALFTSLKVEIVVPSFGTVAQSWTVMG